MSGIQRKIYLRKEQQVSLLTLVCTEVDKYVVVEDQGFVSQYRGIPLRPASSREGEIVCGPCDHTEATRYIINRNRLESR